MNPKTKIIENLSHTYCRLKPSSLHGIGVFAIRDIPSGINLFPEAVSRTYHKVFKNEINSLNNNIIKMLDDFFVSEDDYFFIPKSLNCIDISFYLNHSAAPNCLFKPSRDAFYTVQGVSEGEELTVDYATL